MAGGPVVPPLRVYVWRMFFMLVKICIAIGVVVLVVILNVEMVSFVAHKTGSIMFARITAILLVLLWLSFILGALVQFLDEQAAIRLRKQEAAAKKSPRPFTPPSGPGPVFPPKQQ